MENFCTIEPNHQISGKTRGGRSSRRRTERGAAMMAVVALTLFASMILGAVLLNARNQYTLTWARTNSESALLLAEGAINDEISYINIHMYDANANTRSSQNTTANGEPYKGRKGSISGVNGQFWVFTSADAAGTTAWDGNSSTLYITANARVNGAWRQVQIGGPNMYSSIFTNYGVFGVNNNNGTNTTNVTLNGAANLIVNGTVGTNGGVSCGTGQMHFEHATNCNTGGNNQPKFVATGTCAGKPVVTQPVDRPFPSCTEMLKKSCNKTWSELASSNDNSKIRTFNSSNPTLTAGGTKTCGFTGSTLNSSKMSGCNKSPDTKKTAMIFPPGDYYFSKVELDYLSTHEIILDDEGATCGGNPDEKPIRFWLRDTNWWTNWDGDYISMPMRSSKEINTGTCDPKNFRIFYSNDSSNGFRFDVTGRNAPMNVYGAVYAVSDPGMSRCRATFVGDSNSNECVLNGGLIADRVSVYGNCRVNFPGNNLGNKNDPPSGVQYTGGYKCRG